MTEAPVKSRLLMLIQCGWLQLRMEVDSPNAPEVPEESPNDVVPIEVETELLPVEIEAALSLFEQQTDELMEEE